SAAQAFAVLAFGRCAREWWKQPEVDIHRLIGARPGVDRFDMTTGDMAKQRSMRGGRRRRREHFTVLLGSGEAAGEKANGGGFHIAFAAGDLAREAQPRLRLEPQRGIEELWRIEEGV